MNKLKPKTPKRSTTKAPIEEAEPEPAISHGQNLYVRSGHLQTHLMPSTLLIPPFLMHTFLNSTLERRSEKVGLQWCSKRLTRTPGKPSL